MSRPPSARPKTSAGRAQSAARQRGQPQGDIAATPVQRPQSRSSLSRAAAIEPMRTGSRAGPPPSRLGTAARGEIADRPMTGMARPPSSAMRPITQQGLVGPRTQSRMGTGSQRQVLDKSYFMGLLRGKLSQLNHEISRLEGVLAKGERDRTELAIYEKRAEENAKEIKDLQGTLVDYNMIVDRMNTNSDLSEMELDTKEVRKKADEVASSVEELYAERRAREAEAERLHSEIEEQKRLNQAIMSSMDPGIRDRYEECKRESVSLREEVEQKELELKALDDQRSQLETELNNSQLKQKAIELHERIYELTDKETFLTKEKEEQESPEERKAKLLEQVRKNNEEIATIEKQIEQVNEQIEMSHEELREFDNEAETMAGDKNEKYRELRQKEAHIEGFLASYEDEKKLMTLEMEEFADAIVKNLQKISSNLTKVNIGEQVTAMDMSGLSGAIESAANANEMQEVHVRLQEELLSLDELENRLAAEIETLKRRSEELRDQADTFSNLEQLKRQTQRNSQALKEKFAELERNVPELEGHQTALQSRLSQMNTQMDASDELHQLRNAEKKLEFIARNNALVRATVNAKESEINYDEIKKEAMRLRNEYNDYLQTHAAKK